MRVQAGWRAWARVAATPANRLRPPIAVLAPCDWDPAVLHAPRHATPLLQDLPRAEVGPSHAPTRTDTRRGHPLPSWVTQRGASGSASRAMCHDEWEIEQYLGSFLNHEARGVPKNAGVDSEEGFDLSTMHTLMRHMGMPHLAAPAVHIAGTKGKGSVAAIVSTALRAAGLRVGVYTSPHVHSIRERIAVDGEPIAATEMATLIRTRKALIAAAEEELGRPPSHFEVLTALSFAHFAARAVDVMVVETGLGGVRDATNIFPPESVACAVITTLDAEHMSVLGGSMESVAKAKAGIIKKGRAAVISPQVSDQLRRLLQLECHERQGIELDASAEISVQSVSMGRNGPHVWDECDIIRWAGPGLPPLVADTHQHHLWTAAKEHRCSRESGSNQADLVLDNRSRKAAWVLPRVRLALVGQHQHSNAAAAVRALLWLREQEGLAVVDDAAIRKGLECASLAVRFQVLMAPMQSVAGPGIVVLDGAHTPAAAKSLVTTLRQAFLTQQIALVVAMACDKDHAGVMRHLKESNPCVMVATEVSIGGSKTRSLSPYTLLRAYPHQPPSDRFFQADDPDSRSGAALRVEPSMANALAMARRVVGPDGVVCVTGSLHAAGAALAMVKPPSRKDCVECDECAWNTPGA